MQTQQLKYLTDTDPSPPLIRRTPPITTTCNLRGWSRETKWITGIMMTIVFVGVVVGAIVGGVVGSRNHQYPDYSPLQYQLVDNYMGADFFDKFNYFSEVDPTGGTVDYVDQATAQDLNLTYSTGDSAVLRVDAYNEATERGRRSVRIESKVQYDHGLFIFDIAHTPVGCGTWPAVWLLGPEHPWHGEIDIVETDNLAQDGNIVTLHTWEGCSMEGVKRKQTGKKTNLNCGDGDETGCDVQGKPRSDGEKMNRKGGGVYALEMRDAGIRTWFFRRSKLPHDIANPGNVPDPSSWGRPLADFPNTKCDIESHFDNMRIVVNIDLCGEQGADPKLYTEKYHCPGNCTDFVRGNPEYFIDAYWEFKGFKVYQAE
ncbi:glycoside hydrolase family 16 protein [Aspergillus ruber CBS 135680]|uniref:GH16 domain-containing protein n=1 Tax=Aspergillus ruber (strain CBS 135680) TaxID=1388766 RepID=A0A017SFE2_ASPRC|nr:uncharacterized protein EURHEDRAFT_515117 [Aspergillus ruber CBS 135680]EYE95733.1 hypothetical protein EURHEDRAFT_515117 [Aspergillus ruber CBS 135680]